LQVHYNPSRTAQWLIAEAIIEGGKVEQPLELAVISYSPKQ